MDERGTTPRPRTAGEACAFEDVIERFGASLERAVGNYTPPGPDRDDLLQEVVVAVWRALARFRGESSVKTFVLRIAHNKGVDYLALSVGFMLGWVPWVATAEDARVAGVLGATVSVAVVVAALGQFLAYRGDLRQAEVLRRLAAELDEE